jgi:hypothetical protein
MPNILGIKPNAQALVYCLGFKLNAWFHLLPLTHIHWSTCNTEWRIERYRYNDLHVTQRGWYNGVDTLIYM